MNLRWLMEAAQAAKDAPYAVTLTIEPEGVYATARDGERISVMIAGFKDLDGQTFNPILRSIDLACRALQSTAEITAAP